MVAYLFVVLTLAWPSHWLIVERSTPALRRCTAVLCLLCFQRHSRHYLPPLTMSRPGMPGSFLPHRRDAAPT